MLSDEEFGNPKLQALGADAVLLRLNGMLHANRQLSDGLIEAHMLPVLGAFSFHRSTAATKKAVAKLVESGEWHQAGDTCTSKLCPVTEHGVPEGCYRMHDFWNGYGEKAHVVKDRRSKNSRKKDLLGDDFLVAQLIARDGMYCRYDRCGGRRVQRKKEKDTRSPDKFTIDHIDPEGGNDLENLAVCCQECNVFKNRRTPEAAGMTLLASKRIRRLGALDATGDEAWNDDQAITGSNHATTADTDHGGDHRGTTAGTTDHTTNHHTTTPPTNLSSHASAPRARDTHDSGRTTDTDWSGGRSGGGPGLVGGQVHAGAGPPSPPHDDHDFTGDAA
jgi:5-methylcytosine-specific restriction endonuclease McrA